MCMTTMNECFKILQWILYSACSLACYLPSPSIVTKAGQEQSHYADNSNNYKHHSYWNDPATCIRLSYEGESIKIHAVRNEQSLEPTLKALQNTLDHLDRVGFICVFYQLNTINTLSWNEYYDKFETPHVISSCTNFNMYFNSKLGHQ